MNHSLGFGCNIHYYHGQIFMQKYRCLRRSIREYLPNTLISVLISALCGTPFGHHLISHPVSFEDRSKTTLKIPSISTASRSIPRRTLRPSRIMSVGYLRAVAGCDPVSLLYWFSIRSQELFRWPLSRKRRSDLPAGSRLIIRRRREITPRINRCKAR